MTDGKSAESGIAPADTLPMNEFLDDVLAGLSRPDKRLHPKYFYDEVGSKLFDRITELEEYYPTRTEIAIMKRSIDDIVYRLGRGVRLVEYGSGSSVKTRILLDRLPDPTVYVPVDISCEHLSRTASELEAAYPQLAIEPLCADYTGHYRLPRAPGACRKTVVFFPGSTIGNFERDEARAFLNEVAEVVGPQGGLLIGVDLQKDPGVLEAAYNDAEGITAAFNLNLLTRINRELQANFDLSGFRHFATYDQHAGRIEMYLESTRAQAVRISGVEFEFDPGERIFTEASHKYTLEGFSALVADSWNVVEVWIDPQQFFSVQYLSVRDTVG